MAIKTRIYIEKYLLRFIHFNLNPTIYSIVTNYLDHPCLFNYEGDLACKIIACEKASVRIYKMILILNFLEEYDKNIVFKKLLTFTYTSTLSLSFSLSQLKINPIN